MSEAAPSAGSDEFAQRVGRLLFPGSPGGDRTLTFLALPSARSTRYLIPSRPRSAAAAMVGRQLIGGRGRTRAARLVATLALRSGVGSLVWPYRIRVSERSDSSDSILGWLSARLGRDVWISVGFGRPRANRKPVLQVTDRSGRLLGFAKVGHTELTRRLVRDEGAALRRLGHSRLEVVEVPRLVTQEVWNGLELLLMTPLRLGPTTVAGAVDRRLLEQGVSEIAATAGVETVRWSNHALRTLVCAALDELGERGSGLQPALTLLDAQNPTFAFGSWHGDLNPGNLAVVGDRLAVWDWERYETGVPVGFDLLHHDFQRDVTVRSRPPQEAARDLVTTAASRLDPLGIDNEQAPAVAVCYLLWLGIRFLRDRQAEAGAVLGAVNEWLAPVLRDTLVERGVR